MKYETRVWRPFQRDAYHWAWYEEKLSGIIKELGREIRYCHQRICRGYCDHDIFSIYDWFLGIMPSMLEEFRDNLHGCPDAPGLVSHRVFPDDADKDTESMKVWTAILDKMVFLLKEADENTCGRTNQYEEAFHNASREFEEKYGEWGEKLLTLKEQDDMKNNRGQRIYFPGDVEEYKELSDQYMEEERVIAAYRRDCKDEALKLFSEWFFDLWD
jgi:hypothetical protein